MAWKEKYRKVWIDKKTWYYECKECGTAVGRDPRSRNYHECYFNIKMEGDTKKEVN